MSMRQKGAESNPTVEFLHKGKFSGVTDTAILRDKAHYSGRSGYFISKPLKEKARGDKLYHKTRVSSALEQTKSEGSGDNKSSDGWD